MEYLDFELEISPGSGCDYPVAVIRSPAGEAREMMHFPFGELELENNLLVESCKVVPVKSLTKSYRFRLECALEDSCNHKPASQTRESLSKIGYFLEGMQCIMRLRSRIASLTH